MTPIFKTGTRVYRAHYSLSINGERHEKEYEFEGQNEKFVEKKLRQHVADPDVNLIIHSIIRVK